MAIALWRQMRIWGIQKTAIELEMARFDNGAAHTGASGAEPPNLPPVVRATLAFRALAENTCISDLLHRYETSYAREFTRAQAAIQKLRRQEMADSKEAAKATSGSAATLISLPHFAALAVATFMDPEEEYVTHAEPPVHSAPTQAPTPPFGDALPQEAFLQSEPMTRNETHPPPASPHAFPALNLETVKTNNVV